MNKMVKIIKLTFANDQGVTKILDQIMHKTSYGNHSQVIKVAMSQKENIYHREFGISMYAKIPYLPQGLDPL